MQFGAHATGSDASSCLPFDPLPLCLFPFDSCLLVRRWIHKIKGINGLRATKEKGHLHSNLIGIGRDAVETAGTPALSGVCLLFKLVF